MAVGLVISVSTDPIMTEYLASRCVVLNESSPSLHAFSLQHLSERHALSQSFVFNLHLVYCCMGQDAHIKYEVNTKSNVTSDSFELHITSATVTVLVNE